MVVIDYDRQVDVPYEVLQYCDVFTRGSDRNDLHYTDCVYMNLGYYGNDLEELKKMRQRTIPIFE